MLQELLPNQTGGEVNGHWVDGGGSVDNGNNRNTYSCGSIIMGNENYGRIDRSSYYQGSEDKSLPRVCLMCNTQVQGTQANLERHVNANHPKVWNGYDYTNQAWIIQGVYAKCGCPEPGTIVDPGQPGGPGGPKFVATLCRCYGRLHEGEPPMIGASIH
jgi:hypothetical protein